MLKIRLKNNKYNAVWLVEPKVSIGRKSSNDMVLNDERVADNHVEILVDNERLTLKNLVSGRPVFVNETEVTGSCALKPEDILTVGDTELQIVDPKREAPAERVAATKPVGPGVTQVRAPKVTGWALKANHESLSNRVFPLKPLNIIGRSSDCDISLPAAHLSRRHAELKVVDGLLYVKDLDSSNGTFLNGKRITEARVKRGDELRFDTLSFGVIGPADDLTKTSVRGPKGAGAQGAKSTAAPKPKAAGGGGATNRASVHARASEQDKADSPRKGRAGMAILVVLVVVVVVALVLTRN